MKRGRQEAGGGTDAVQPQRSRASSAHVVHGAHGGGVTVTGGGNRGGNSESHGSDDVHMCDRRSTAAGKRRREVAGMDDESDGEAECSADGDDESVDGDTDWRERAARARRAQRAGVARDRRAGGASGVT